MPSPSVLLMSILCLIICKLPPSIVNADDKVAPAVVNALPPVAEDKAREFAQSLVEAIENGDDTREFIDWAALIDRSALGLDAPEKLIVDFRKGVESTQGIFGLLQTQVEEGATYKFIRVFEDRDGTRVKMRIHMSETSANYHDFLLTEADDRVRAADFKVAYTGEDYSKTMRRFLIPLVANWNQGLPQKLSTEDSVSLTHAKDVTSMVKSIQDGHPEKIGPILNKLPEAVRNQKLILLIELNAVRALDDLDRSQAVIERLLRLYPADPAVELLAIDYFVEKQELPRALLCVEGCLKNIGEDGYLLTRLADLQLKSGKHELARGSIEKAIQSEPDFMDAYWTLVTVADTEMDFATVNKTLQKMVSDFGVELDLDTMRKEPCYEKFVKSIEFEDLVKFLKSQ